MSVVGPRPPLPWEAELYDARAAGRLVGKPGMTGLWQVSGRGQLRFDEMVDLDLHYLNSWSPWLDFKILARTPAAVWSRSTE
jgi:lipopolysaccharide/colanic/teichoic acid biosynthesis glycosyltransferase